MNTADKLDIKKQQYAFICYSHANRGDITADIEYLEEQGFTVWYDELIPGGVEWNDELARHIQNCTWFLYFVSPTSVESLHCRNELNYAQQHERKILSIEIAPTQVPPGLQLTLNNRQILFRHKIPAEEYQTQLKLALQRKSSAMGTGLQSNSAPNISSKSKFSPAKWSLFGGAALAIVAIVFAINIFLSQPSDFEFGQRDWVVVGEFENRTQDPLLSDSLELSLRLALEQSDFANVLPASFIRSANQRMQREPDAPLDREAAVEVAQRENAKAAIVGNITEIGENYTITIELLNAIDGSTIWTAASSAEGLSEVLPSVDDVSRQVRERLGESLSAIENSTLPLAKVTTGDLEALRAYSLSEKGIARGDWEGAVDLLERALSIDPAFAMAHGKMAAIYSSMEVYPKRVTDHLQTALNNPDRLSRREQLYLEASTAWQKTPEEMRSSWKMMSSLYPDQAVGFNNLGEVLRTHFLDYEQSAIEFASAIQKPHPWTFVSYHNLAQSLLAQNKPEESLLNFNIAREMDDNLLDFGIADAYVVLGKHENALQIIEEGLEAESLQLREAARLRQIGMLTDLGEIEAALELSNTMLETAVNSRPILESQLRAVRVALYEGNSDRSLLEQSLLEAFTFEHHRLSTEPDTTPVYVLTHLVILSRIAVRSGFEDLAEASIEIVRQRIPGNGFPVDQALLELLEAELLLQENQPDEALRRIERSATFVDLFQANESRARAAQMLGDEDTRLEILRTIASQRGRAFAERINRYYGQSFNILDWARADRVVALAEATAGRSVAPE